LTERATDYLQRLSRLLISTAVTLENGEQVSLDEGAGAGVDVVRRSVSAGGKILLVGNGGSAAVVSHMQNDFCKAAGVRALVFTEQPLLTALSNDDGYDSAFETATRLWVDTEDVLIAISSSGRSDNILRASKVALAVGASLVTLSGFSTDNPLRTMGAVNFHVNSDSYGLVETAHAAIGHFITDAIANILDNEGAN
jgi:D-sedoheptulose 7-phosphate isomerase